MKLAALCLPLALLAACSSTTTESAAEAAPAAAAWAPAETNGVGTPAAWTTTLDPEHGRAGRRGPRQSGLSGGGGGFRLLRPHPRTGLRPPA